MNNRWLGCNIALWRMGYYFPIAFAKQSLDVPSLAGSRDASSKNQGDNFRLFFFYKIYIPSQFSLVFFSAFPSRILCIHGDGGRSPMRAVLTPFKAATAVTAADKQLH